MLSLRTTRGVAGQRKARGLFDWMDRAAVGEVPRDIRIEIPRTQKQGTAMGSGDHGNRIALCLSGGGFRATLFHCGALRRLNELGILSRVHTVSSVSGGSITNAVLATRWDELNASKQNGVFTAFDELVAAPLAAFCEKDLRTEVLLWDRVNPINWPKLVRRDYSVTDRLAEAYAKELGLGTPLSALTASPAFVFCATNMENGALWQFRPHTVGSWYTGWAEPGDVTVSQAVAASSAYPIAFPPLVLSFDPPKEFRGGHGNDEESQSHESITVTDGGVYDNLGLEPVREGHDVFLVSDAGRPLSEVTMTKLTPYSRVSRSLDIIWNQVGSLRKRWLIDVLKSPVEDIEGAYWGLTSDVGHYGLPDAPSYPKSIVDLLGEVRTDLDAFTEGETGCLINQGYALANVAVLRWTKAILPAEIPEFRWPCPDLAEEAAAAEALRESGNRGVLKDLWHSLTNRVDDWL